MEVDPPAPAELPNRPTDIHANVTGNVEWPDERIENVYANSISQLPDISEQNTMGIRGKRIQALDIEIKQQDKYCTVKELIQFRPATFEELRRQLDLRSDSLGAEMKSNDAGYVHAKDNNSQDNINHFIHEYDTTNSAISFRAKIYGPSSTTSVPQFRREIFTEIKEKKEAEKEFKKAVREDKQAFLAKSYGANYLQIKLGNIAFDESIVVEYIYLVTLRVSRNLRYSYNRDTSKLDNIHYHQFDEETSWKLRIPLVRSGGYLLTPNPGEGVKEDMNSQLDLLHMNDEQVWSLTKQKRVSPISIYLNAEVKNGQRCLRKIVNCYEGPAVRASQRTEFVVPVDDAIDNRISLTPGSVPLYEKPHQKCLQTIDLDFYFHKAKMNHFDLIEETLQKSKERPNNSIFLGMDFNVHKTDLGSKVGLDVNLNLKRNELFAPPTYDQSQPSGNKLEFWFIIDCSGSMRGRPIYSAKQALKILVKNLPMGCTFNMIKFGSAHHFFRECVQYYDKESVKYAEHWIDQLGPDLGGTDILSPIKDVVNFSACENRVKQIFLLTDGSVGNTHEIIRVASKAVKPYVNENGQSFPNFYDNRIFTLAIGSGASQSLCRELAMKSHGTMEACDDTDIAEHSAKLLIASISASKPDNQIAFDPNTGIDFALINARGDLRSITKNKNLDVSSLFNQQSIPNDLTESVSFISQQLEINSSEIQESDKLRVTIKYQHAGDIERSFFKDCPISEDSVSIERDNGGLFTRSVGYFAAYKNAIHRLEYRAMVPLEGDGPKEINAKIAKLSIEGHILSKRTAFIGVQKTETPKPKTESNGTSEKMEIDSAEETVGASEPDVGASDIEMFSFESHIAGRGFDDGICMIDSIGDLSQMKAGAARKRGGRRIPSAAPQGVLCGSSRRPHDPMGIMMDPTSPDFFDLSNEPAGRATRKSRKSFESFGEVMHSSSSCSNGFGWNESLNKTTGKDNSLNFMQLLNSGNIDGSFTDTAGNRSIFDSILQSKKQIDLTKLPKILGIKDMKTALTILAVFIFETYFPAERNQWFLFTLKSKQFLQSNDINDIEPFLKKLR